MKPTVYESHKYVIVSAIRKAAVGTCLLFATRAGADHLASIAKNWISVANLIETERGFHLRVPFFFQRSFQFTLSYCGEKDNAGSRSRVS